MHNTCVCSRVNNILIGCRKKRRVRRLYFIILLLVSYNLDTMTSVRGHPLFVGGVGEIEVEIFINNVNLSFTLWCSIRFVIAIFILRGSTYFLNNIYLLAPRNN